MDILIRPYGSLMQRWIHDGDEWIVYAHRHDLEPLVTLYGADLLQIVALHFTQARAVLTLAQKAQTLVDQYPQRRLLGQHKPLRGRDGPSGPHRSTTW